MTRTNRLNITFFDSKNDISKINWQIHSLMIGMKH